MDFSKIYSKTSDWASSAAKKSKKFINQARDMMDESPGSSSAGPSGPSFSDSMRQAFSQPGAGATQTTQSGIDISLPPNLTLNNLEIRFLKLLDEGGFSYVFKAEDLNSGRPLAVKRLLVQDEETARQVRNEIKIMKLLGKHPYIIDFIATKELREGNKKVFYIVMELAKTGLIQLMQRRLDQKRKFKDSEVLSIFHDICRGVEALHRLDPPLQHRDLKVENVLRVGSKFKLCDFGSASTRVYTLDSKRERSLAEEDINKHTTLAYRSPEMCDMYSDFAITEKSDIWALGCILYKLCFFNGPFEDAAAEGSFLPIINCKYTIPRDSTVSAGILTLIRDLLEINVDKRPDIWTVLERVAQLRSESNDVKRPSKTSKPSAAVHSSGSSKRTSSSSATPPTKPVQGINRRSNLTTTAKTTQKRKDDLFDLLGGPTSQQVTTTKKSPQAGRATSQVSSRANQQQSRPQQHQQKDMGFDDNEEWAANFSDDDAFGEDPFQQPSSPQSPKMSVTRPQENAASSNATHQRSSSNHSQKNASLLDDLDWEPISSTSTSAAGNTSMDNAPHQRSRSGNFASDLDFSGLSLHQRSSPDINGQLQSTPQKPRPKSTDNILPPAKNTSRNDAKKNNILAALDQAHQHDGNRGNHNRFNSFDVSSLYYQQQQQSRNDMGRMQPQYHTPQRPPQSGYYNQQQQGYMNTPPMRSSYPQQPRGYGHMQNAQMPRNFSNDSQMHRSPHQGVQNRGSVGSNGTNTPTSPSTNPFDNLF